MSRNQVSWRHSVSALYDTKKIYTVSIIQPSERAQNSGWEQSLPGSSKSIWDTLFVFRVSVDSQTYQSRRRHHSPVEQTSSNSKWNLESSSETLVNCMCTESLTCEKKFDFPVPHPSGGNESKKNISFSGRTLCGVLLRRKDWFSLDRNLR